MSENPYVKPVNGLLWARPVNKPAFIPVSRPRGAKAAGLRYERQFAKFLKPLGCIHGQWFEFEDKSGVRYCQTDIIFPVSKRLFSVIEVKYTLVDRAYDQLLDVYGPVVEAAYNVPVGLVVVYKNYRGGGQGVPFVDIPMATQFSVDTGHVANLHWIGQPVAPKPNDRLLGVLEIAHSDQTGRPRASPTPPSVMH